MGAQSWTAWWGRGHAQASQLDSQHARNTNALPNPVPDLCIHTVLADLQGGVLRAECGVDRRTSRLASAALCTVVVPTLNATPFFQLSAFTVSAFRDFVSDSVLVALRKLRRLNGPVHRVWGWGGYAVPTLATDNVYWCI